MFGRIAPRYDLGNRVISFGRDQVWRRRAADILLARTKSRPYLLDLGTGTGDLAMLLSAFCPDARVVGIDLTKEMLERAVAKIHSTGAGNSPTLVNGDSLDFPFPNETFDGIISAFVLRNLTSLESAFLEMRRVVKPDAPIVALEITRPRLPIWRSIYEFYFYGLAPFLGGMLSGDLPAYRYLPHSLSVFVGPDELKSIMSRAGIRNVRYFLMNLGTVAIHFGYR